MSSYYPNVWEQGVGNDVRIPGLRHRRRRRLRSSNEFSSSMPPQGPYTPAYPVVTQEPVGYSSYYNNIATPYQTIQGPNVHYPSPSYAQFLPVLQSVLTNPEKLFDPIDPYLYLPYHARRSTKQGPLEHYFDQFLRQLYRHILLRIPSLYFTRVSRVYKDAGISRSELKSLTKENERARSGHRDGGRTDVKHSRDASWESLKPFETKWADFLNTLIDEWTTLNVVSVLLLSTLVSMLTIQDAASSPITRTATLLSLVSTLWSLSFGCIYIVRFGTMKTLHKAAGFAQDIRRRRTSIWWNVLILLAMPAIWLTWSMFFFCVAVISYVWTSGDTHDQPNQIPIQTPLSSRAEIGPRAAVSALFGLGFIYFIFVVKTFRSYHVDPDDRSFWYSKRNERSHRHHRHNSGSYAGYPTYSNAPQPVQYPYGYQGGSYATQPNVPPNPQVIVVRSSPTPSNDSSSSDETGTPSSPPSYGHSYGYGQPQLPYNNSSSYRYPGPTIIVEPPYDQPPSVQPRIQVYTDETEPPERDPTQFVAVDYPPVVPVPPSGYSPPLPSLSVTAAPESSAYARPPETRIVQGSRGSDYRRRSRSRSAVARDPTSTRPRSRERQSSRRRQSRRHDDRSRSYTRSRSHSPVDNYSSSQPTSVRHRSRHRSGREQFPTIVPVPVPTPPERDRYPIVYSSPPPIPLPPPVELLRPTETNRLASPPPPAPGIRTPIPVTARRVSFDLDPNTYAQDRRANSSPNPSSSSSDYVSADEGDRDRRRGSIRGSGSDGNSRMRTNDYPLPTVPTVVLPSPDRELSPATSAESGSRGRWKKLKDWTGRRGSSREDRRRRVDSYDSTGDYTAPQVVSHATGYVPAEAGSSRVNSTNDAFVGTTQGNENEMPGQTLRGHERLSTISERTEPFSDRNRIDEYDSDVDSYGEVTRGPSPSIVHSYRENRQSPSYADILTRLNEYNTTQMTVVEGQRDIMRYIRELNTWIESDVRARGSGGGVAGRERNQSQTRVLDEDPERLRRY